MSCGVSREDLMRRQGFPLGVKVKLTKERIKEWYEHWNGLVYVSFSGGKDSLVLRHIVKEMYPDVPAVFCDTGLEYPEVREIALANADVVLRPKMTFKAVIEKYGYPIPSKEQARYIRDVRTSKSAKLRAKRLNLNNGFSAISTKWMSLCHAPFSISEQCCDVMKKNPFKKFQQDTGRYPMTATMADESSIRTSKYIQNGCNAFHLAKPISTPMAFWRDTDVLEFIVEHRLEYAYCYGDIIKTANGFATTKENRTGCMFCMFGIQFDGTPNRFQRMERDYPKQWKYCIENLGIGQVLDYVGIPYQYEPTLWEEQ